MSVALDSALVSAFAEELAAVAAAITLPLFRTPIIADNKAVSGGFDPVTEADCAAERAMRRLIHKHFPEHGIEGEEYGPERPNADYVWVLDPIDGTRAFISGLPLWGTLIGLKYRGEPVFGLMHQPFTDEHFIGATLAGSPPIAQYKRGGLCRSLQTRQCLNLAQATLSATTPQMFTGPYKASYEQVENNCRLVRYGYDCYAYAMLAAGHLDLVIEAGLKPCDIVALIPLIRAAGGIVTNWQDEPATSGGNIIAAGSCEIHQAALSLLNG